MWLRSGRKTVLVVDVPTLTRARYGIGYILAGPRDFGDKHSLQELQGEALRMLIAVRRDPSKT